MLKTIYTRWLQKYRTVSFPQAEPVLPERFRGMPCFSKIHCPPGCEKCVQVCPTDAITRDASCVHIDLGKCLFCTECTHACPHEFIHLSRDYRMAVRTRNDLILKEHTIKRAQPLEGTMRRLLKRSFKLRHVSAGGCNACEMDTNVLTTVVFDLSRFGIEFVASPRHADGLLISGPVTQNMKVAVQKTYDAIPHPKVVIAVGSCAIAGGPYRDHPEVCNGVDAILPVDLYIPGCPPHPITILDGLLRLLGRRDDSEDTQHDDEA